MILATFKEQHETTETLAGCGRRGWRWVIETGQWQTGVYVSLDEQVIFHDRDAQWGDATRYITLALVPGFEIGQDHHYYDGPHCSVKLGWLRIAYSWNWCKKCMPDEEETE